MIARIDQDACCAAELRRANRRRLLSRMAIRFPTPVTLGVLVTAVVGGAVMSLAEAVAPRADSEHSGQARHRG